MKVYYFSPTGSTKRIVKTMAEGFGAFSHETDLTMGINRAVTLQASEIAIIGVPVYMGRVPKPAIDSIKKISGNKTPVITVVVYGNRAYDDALLELNNTCINQGFVVIASGAFVAEHSMNKEIATGRPNLNDLQTAYRFGKLIAEKYQTGNYETVTVNGTFPYREAFELPIFPAANAQCNNCLVCAKHCPVGAIPEENPKETNKALCIKCMRCVKDCATQARQLQLNEHTRFFLTQTLKTLCQGEKQPEIII